MQKKIKKKGFFWFSYFERLFLIQLNVEFNVELSQITIQNNNVVRQISIKCFYFWLFFFKEDLKYLPSRHVTLLCSPERFQPVQDVVMSLMKILGVPVIRFIEISIDHIIINK